MILEIILISVTNFVNSLANDIMWDVLLFRTIHKLRNFGNLTVCIYSISWKDKEMRRKVSHLLKNCPALRISSVPLATQTAWKHKIDTLVFGRCCEKVTWAVINDSSVKFSQLQALKSDFHCVISRFKSLNSLSFYFKFVFIVNFERKFPSSIVIYIWTRSLTSLLF